MGGFIVGNICLSYNPDSVHPSIRYIPLLILYPLIIKYIRRWGYIIIEPWPSQSIG